MTGPIMIKWRFLEENVDSANLIVNSIGYSFLNKLPAQVTNLSIVLVSGETPGTKKSLPPEELPSDKRRFQSYASAVGAYSDITSVLLFLRFRLQTT